MAFWWLLYVGVGAFGLYYELREAERTAERTGRKAEELREDLCDESGRADEAEARVAALEQELAEVKKGKG